MRSSKSSLDRSLDSFRDEEFKRKSTQSVQSLKDETIQLRPYPARSDSKNRISLRSSSSFELNTEIVRDSIANALNRKSSLLASSSSQNEVMEIAKEHSNKRRSSLINGTNSSQENMGKSIKDTAIVELPQRPASLDSSGRTRSVSLLIESRTRLSHEDILYDGNIKEINIQFMPVDKVFDSFHQDGKTTPKTSRPVSVQIQPQASSNIPVIFPEIQRYSADDLLNQGVAFFNRNNFEDANAKWRQAFDVTAQDGDFFRQAKLFNNQACLQRQIGSMQGYGIFLKFAWEAYLAYFRSCMAAFEATGPWLEIISNSINLDHVINFSDQLLGSEPLPFTPPTTNRSNIDLVSTNLGLRSQGPPIVILLLDIISNIANYLLLKGEYESCRTWLDYGISLCGNIHVEFPLPSTNLNQFVLQRIPHEMVDTCDLLTVDHLLENTARLKLSSLHRTSLLSLSRFLSTSGYCYMQLGQNDISDNYHGRAQDIISFYNSQVPAPSSSKRTSSLPVSKDASHKHEALILSNWASLRLFNSDFSHALSFSLSAKNIFKECGDYFCAQKQNINISFVMLGLVTGLIRFGLISDKKLLDSSISDKYIKDYIDKLKIAIKFSLELKDWISSVSFTVQIASTYNFIGEPMKALEYIAHISQLDSGINTLELLPEHLVDHASMTIIKSIYLLVLNGSDLSVIDHTKWRHDLSLLLSQLFFSEEPNAPFDSSYLTFLMKSFMSRIEIRLSLFQHSSQQSVIRVNHRYIGLLDSLHQLYLVDKEDKSLAIGIEKEKDIVTYLTAPDVPSPIPRLSDFLSNLEVSNLRKDDCMKLLDLYLLVIEKSVKNNEQLVLVKLRERAIECLLSGLNISESGLHNLVELLSGNQNDDSLFEISAILQNNPYFALPTINKT